MDFLSLFSTILSVSKPHGLWESLIFGLEQIIKNYGLTIILITVGIKILMLPLDVFMRYTNKRNSAKQAIVQPELQKLQKKYANNKDALNQKTMEVYKKHNYNIMGSCFGMLFNMAITMVIFFTLFSALNKIASYKIYTEYITLNETYIETEELALETPGFIGTQEELEIYATELAKTAVVNKYGEIKEGFLWVNNIWRPDTSTSIVLSYKNFISNTKVSKTEITEADYNKIVGPVRVEYNGWNGYFILIVLSAAITYLSTKVGFWIGRYNAKKSGRPYVDAMSQNKILLYIMPIVMALFTFFYNAMFGIYIVSGALFGLLTSPFITMLVDNMYEKLLKKEEEKTKISYSRK